MINLNHLLLYHQIDQTGKHQLQILYHQQCLHRKNKNRKVLPVKRHNNSQKESCKHLEI